MTSNARKSINLSKREECITKVSTCLMFVFTEGVLIKIEGYRKGGRNRKSMKMKRIFDVIDVDVDSINAYVYLQRAFIDHFTRRRMIFAT